MLIEQTPDALKVIRRVLKLPQFLTWCAPRRPTQNSSHSSSLGLLGRGRLLAGALARGALGTGARGAFRRGATGLGAAALAALSNLNTATACDSTEAAKLIQAQAGDDKDARSEALTALVQTELFEAILALQDADDPDLDPGKRVDMLSSAAKNIATLTRSSVNLKQFQAKVEKDTRDRLLAEQRAALDAMGSKGGVTEDTKRAIREALGIM